MVMQPGPGGSGGIHNQGYESNLSTGYNHGAQMGSLLCMQGLLLGASEQVSNTLKTLLLKAYENIFAHESTILSSMKNNLRARHLTSGPSQASMAPLKLKNKIYAFEDSYTSNLERKGRSGRAGIITELMPSVSLGVAYNCHKNDARELNGIQLGSYSGPVKSSTSTDSFSAVVSLHPEETGVVGHLAGCYGWGTVKNTRRFTYTENEERSKGKPDISLNGGLIQLGYRLKLSDVVSFIPYSECMFSHVTWSDYKEKHGSLPCSIGKNQEQTVEYSIGLRGYYKLGKLGQVQGWVAEVSGCNKTNSLTSKPLLPSIERYTAHVPGLNKRYIRTELGLAYTATATDTLSLGLNGSVRLENMKKSNSQNVSVHMQYRY